MTSIPKLSSSTYLSWALQFNEGFSRACPPCLCLCDSLWLAAFVDDLGPTSVSLMAIITAVAAWMAAWLTIDYIASAYVILVCIFFSLFLALVCFFWSDFVCSFETFNLVTM